MVTAGDFKKGLTVEWDGGIWTIVDFQHVKPGKGAAFVRTKIKNIITGAVGQDQKTAFAGIAGEVANVYGIVVQRARDAS